MASTTATAQQTPAPSTSAQPQTSAAASTGAPSSAATRKPRGGRGRRRAAPRPGARTRSDQSEGGDATPAAASAETDSTQPTESDKLGSSEDSARGADEGPTTPATLAATAAAAKNDKKKLGWGDTPHAEGDLPELDFGSLTISGGEQKKAHAAGKESKASGGDRPRLTRKEKSDRLKEADPVAWEKAELARKAKELERKKEKREKDKQKKKEQKVAQAKEADTKPVAAESAPVKQTEPTAAAAPAPAPAAPKPKAAPKPAKQQPQASTAPVPTPAPAAKSPAASPAAVAQPAPPTGPAAMAKSPATKPATAPASPSAKPMANRPVYTPNTRIGFGPGMTPPQWALGRGNMPPPVFGRGRGGRPQQLPPFVNGRPPVHSAPPVAVSNAVKPPPTAPAADIAAATAAAAAKAEESPVSTGNESESNDVKSSQTSRGSTPANGPPSLAIRGRGAPIVAARNAFRPVAAVARGVPGEINPRYAHLPFHPHHRFPPAPTAAPPQVSTANAAQTPAVSQPAVTAAQTDKLETVVKLPTKAPVELSVKGAAAQPQLQPDQAPASASLPVEPVKPAETSGLPPVSLRLRPLDQVKPDAEQRAPGRIPPGEAVDKSVSISQNEFARPLEARPVMPQHHSEHSLPPHLAGNQPQPPPPAPLQPYARHDSPIYYHHQHHQSFSPYPGSSPDLNPYNDLSHTPPPPQLPYGAYAHPQQQQQQQGYGMPRPNKALDIRAPQGGQPNHNGSHRGSFSSNGERRGSPLAPFSGPNSFAPQQQQMAYGGGGGVPAWNFAGEYADQQQQQSGRGGQQFGGNAAVGGAFGGAAGAPGSFVAQGMTHYNTNAALYQRQSPAYAPYEDRSQQQQQQQSAYAPYEQQTQQQQPIGGHMQQHEMQQQGQHQQQQWGGWGF